MPSIPSKHYVAHAGDVFVQDVFGVETATGMKFGGRYTLMPKGAWGAEVENPDMTAIGYDTPREAFLATHKLMNISRKLGKCLVGGDPFINKRKGK
jgi:hypothetical protein